MATEGRREGRIGKRKEGKEEGRKEEVRKVEREGEGLRHSCWWMDAPGDYVKFGYLLSQIRLSVVCNFRAP